MLMRIRQRFLPSLAPVLLLVNGCGEPEATKISACNNLEDLSLVGIWKTDCEDLTALGDANIKGVRSELGLECDGGVQAGKLDRYFLDSTCETAAVRAGSGGGFEDTLVSTSGGVSEGHLTLAYLHGDLATVFEESLRTDYAARDVCANGTDWTTVQLNTFIGIGGDSCEFAVGRPYVGRALGGADYDIYKVDQNTNPPTLVLGDRATGDGSSEATRPTAYNSSKIYRKQ